jgi:diguanylate cyclase (GGDEF)-like protein
MPWSRRALESRSRLRLRRSAGVASIAGALLCVASYQLAGGDPLSGPAKALYLGLFVVSVAVCLLRALAVREERGVWLTLTAALTFNAGAEIYYWWFVEDLPDIPLVTAADALWLLFYPLCYVSIALLVRSRVRRVRLSQALDGIIVGLALIALVVAVLLPSAIASADGDALGIVVNIAYPLGDVVLLCCLLGMLTLLDWRPDRTAVMLGLGVVVTAGADIALMVLLAQGVDERELGILSALWPVGALLLAWSAWTPTPRQRPDIPDGVRALVLVGVGLGVAIVVLVVGQFTHIGPTAGLIAIAAVLAAVARGVLAFRENLELAESRRQAVTDDLTGLANRRHFNERLSQAIAESQRDGTELAVLLMDLDRFKEINDTLGHQSGDVLLRAVAERLSRAAGDRDTVARFGGDEFAVLLPGVGGLRATRRIARTLIAEIGAPIPVDELSISTEVSIGIAMCPEHGAEAGLLVRRADMAMYVAKRAHTGCEAFTAEHDGYTPERITLVAELRRAIAGDELVVEFQPKIDLSTGLVSGAEALVRWQHPERGLVMPGDFIPAAEQTALIRPLTMYVLEKALSQVGFWRGRGHDVSVAVNLSVRHLLDDGLPGDIGALLRKWSVPPGALELEITEGTLMADPRHALETLTQLDDMGVRLAIDDFGVGYSSMEYLRKLPVDVLKIDKSFVLGMCNDESDATIVRSVIELGHNLGLRIVAEGVEDLAIVERLCALGCEYAQGYHFGRSMAPEAFERLLGRPFALASSTALAQAAAAIEPPREA